jgi:hypothetical protein
MTDLSGTSFLNSYLTTPYNVAVTGMINPSNYSLAVTSPIGTVTNPLGSGVLTFTTPITKDNAGSSRSIAVTGIFTRPSGVTGSQYQITLLATDSVLSATFIYPSFTVWTNSVSTPPQRGDIVAGTGFRFGVTALADQTRTFAAMVTNSQGIPRVYWLGVRAAASQPTSFKTGASASLLSDVVITTSTVSLSADSPPVGYVPELFRLYGIILQPGNTYVSIS